MHVGYSLLTLFPDRVGGTETYVRDLLAQYARGNGPEKVTVLANRHVLEAYRSRVRGPVSIHHVRSYPPGDRYTTRAIAMASAWALPGRAARDVPAGLDVVHYPVTVPIPRPRGPSVVTIHEIVHHLSPGTLNRAERAYRRVAYDGSVRAATVVVTTNNLLKASLVDRVGLDPDRVEVIYYGVDRERFSPGPSSADDRIEALNLPEQYLLFPANVWPHKNHERLIEAFARVPDDELHLILAGQTYGRLQPLLELARRLGVGTRVHHLGFIAPDDLPALYRRARATVFPSLYDNFPSPPLESMACGCPVACSLSGAMGELYEGAVEPIEPEDVSSITAAIERACTNDDLRESLRKAGFERAQRYTWETAARRHTDAYARAAAAA